LDFFRDELPKIQSKITPSSLCLGIDETYSAIVEQLDRNIKEIVIVQEKTAWVYSLFPALLYWRTRGAKIYVVLKREGEDGIHGPYRRRLLRALGAQLSETDTIPVRAFLFDGDTEGKARGVVGMQYNNSLGEAVKYSSRPDSWVIVAIRDRLRRFFPNAQLAPSTRPRLIAGKLKNLMSALRRVQQYARPKVKLSLGTIPIDSMVFLTRYVRDYKYRQIHYLLKLYYENFLGCFEPAVVDFGEGHRSIVTPPVVEESSGKYVVIEGSSRAVYCRDNKIDKIMCIVAKGIQDPLPSKQRIDLGLVDITKRTLEPDSRYGGLDLKNFRKIELCVHPPDNFR